MKTKNIIYSLLFVASISFTGCKGYLDVVPDNDIETIETTFEKREDAYTWFKTCYSMITMDISDINACPAFLKEVFRMLFSALFILFSLSLYYKYGEIGKRYL